MIGGTKLQLRNMNSIHKRLSLLFVLLYLHLKSGHSALITFPRDAEIYVNHSTYLNCSTSILSEQIHWYHNRVGENQTNYVYYKGQFNKIYADRYSVEINNKTGECNLIIRSVQHGDAGRYVCQDDVGLGNSGSAELIVLDGVLAKSDEACNCESYKNAVICIVVLLLIPLSVGVVTLTLMLIYNRRPKRTDFFHEFFPCMKKSQPKEINEITDVNNPEVSLKNELPEEEPEDIDERNKVEEGIEEDPEEALMSSAETVYQAAKPIFVRAIFLSGNNGLKPLSGVTVLGNELFAVTEGSKEISVYDSKTFQHERNIIVEIREMTNPLDIASSKKADCLYIIYQVSKETESRVMRLNREGEVLEQWKSGGQTGRLSTYKSNVVVCLFDKHLITEYSPKGDKIREVRLSPAANLSHPWHAVKVSGMHFVVSFGEGKDPLHRVCVVDLEGNIKASTNFEELKIFPKLKVPVCLVEDNERFIVVADKDNNRILLLSPHLEYRENFFKIELQKEDYPVRLCFDETNSKLFVAVNKCSNKKNNNNCIMIYNTNSE